MEELTQVLWRERELLEMLTFKLEEEELVLASGRTRWLAYAVREVDTVLHEIQRTEVLRAATADAVAAAVGLDSNPSLRAMAEAGDEPWRTILLDHRDELLAVTAQISELAAARRALLSADHRATRATVLSQPGVHESSAPPSASVAVDRRTGCRTEVDPRVQEVAYRVALASTERLLHPTLLDFLR